MTRKEFLAAYREELREYPYRHFQSEDELVRFVDDAGESIGTVRPYHFAKSVAARRAWRKLGGLGIPNIYKVRQLPIE